MKRFKGLLGLFFCALVVGGMVPLHAEQAVQWPGNDHYYEAIPVTNGISWSAAQADATVRGGYLVTSTSEAENNFIYSLIQPSIFWSGNTGPWIGGLQPAGSPEPGGNWQWISGEPWGFEGWDAIEPSNSGGIEDRVQFWKKSTLWNDKAANQYAFGYVIEYQIHASATGEISVAIGSVETILAGDSLELGGMLDGMASMLVWDFGDSTYATNTHFPSRAWSLPGSYDVVLTAFNEDYIRGVSSTQTVQVVTLEDVAIHVSLNGDDANDGSSWASAKATLQAGIGAQMFEHGLVLVSNGTYAVTSEIVVDKAITVQSVNGPAVTIVDGGGNNRCFNLSSSSGILSGFTITNGYAQYDGGGITCGNTTPVITNCTITGCVAGDEGGGVNQGTLYQCTVEDNWAVRHGGGLNNGIAYDCTFSSNTASNNGGGAEWSDLYDCLLVDNVATNGGGLEGGSASGCTFSNNLALLNGGGERNCNASSCVFNSNTAVDSGGGTHGGTATDCHISGNTAKYGGGARATDMTDCEVFDNHATLDGGGVFGGASVLFNCNIYSNTANRTGGGIIYSYVHESAIHGNEAQGSGGGGSGARFYNCQVYGNRAESWGGGMSDCVSINCTVVGNEAGLGGGGQSFGTGVSWESLNCIIYGNSANIDGTLDMNVNGSRITPAAYSSCSPDLTHGINGNITNAPILASLSHLAPDSPCIGAGVYTNMSGTDIDGELWLNPPSMGCDEYHGAGSVTGMLQVAIVGNTTALADHSVELVADIRGALYRSEWDFGDGSMAANSPLPSHAWTVPGSYDVVLTAYNDRYPAGVSTTQTIQVLSLEETTIHVSPSGDDDNDGSSWPNAKATIQTGVDAQQYENGLVLVDDGTYGVTNEIVVDKTVVVQSRNGASVTIVDGGGSNRCFNLGSSSCAISGLTISNGFHAADGGGVHASATDAVLTNCVIIGNTAADDGGGVHKCTLLDCSVVDNVASNRGGGTYLSILEGTTVARNYARSHGGGLHSGSAQNCTIIDNETRANGGGAKNCTIYNSMIAGNRAVRGGGGDNVSFYGCSIRNNYATGSGGGANNCNVYSCTIVGNTGSDGGGLYDNNKVNYKAYNSIIYGNTAETGDLNEVKFASGETELASVFSSCSPGLTHGLNGNITTEPQLISFAHLSALSPCIGAGTNAFLSSADLDGQPWLNPPSMGCDEFYAAGSVTGELAVAINGYPVQLVGLPSEMSGEVFGTATMHLWDFGDGSVATNEFFPGHVWNVSGYYDVVLSAFNDTYPAGVSVTQAVQVIVAGDKIVWEGNGHFYQVVAAPDGIAWDEAKAEATARGGYLATPVTADENSYIFGMTQSTNYWNAKTGPWLGGLQVAGGVEPDGGWAWDTGEAWIYDNWSWAEPNNTGGTENRVHFRTSSSGWNDQPVDSDTYGYVVEFQIHESASGGLAVGIGDAARIAVGYPLMLAGRLDGIATKLVWDFADGVAATNTHYPVHAWDVPGEYDVVLTAYNADHPGGISATQTIHVLSLAAGTIHVSKEGNDANDGLGWASAKATIQGGVDAAPAGGIVWVSNGTYAVTDTILVEMDMEIRSVNGPPSTVVDGLASNRCFHMGSDAGLLTGFTVTNGFSSECGGGLLCEHESAIVSNCIVVGNAASDRGGGVAGGTLHDCMLEQNTSGGRGGGGIRTKLFNCMLARNTAGGSGGGASGSRLYGCRVWGNSSLLDGGGVSDSAEIADCWIFENYASRHGGGVNFSIVRNSLIYRNESAQKGGGVKNSDLVNCTLTGNFADLGGGIWQDSSPGRGDAFNSIVFGNFATGGAADVDQASGTVKIIVNSCTSDRMHGADGNITNAPLFADAVGHLQPNSPCINWGNNAYTNATIELDGNPRIIEGYVDMGCYEFQGMVGKADSDEDGLLDEWERLWFGGNVLPENNADGDRQSNGAEYVSGTDPTNSTSYFKSSVTRSDADTGQFIIDWMAISGRVYNVYWTPSLAEDFKPLEIGIQYPVSSYTDTVHSVESSGYYRMVVMRADYDADGDGLPNDWERQYAVADAFADGDHDGHSNMAEFIAGTNPTNGASFFRAANAVAEVNGTKYFVVEWISIPERLYRVQWTTNIAAGFQTLDANIEHPQNSYTDTVHSAEQSGFYKVDVMLK